MADDDMTVTPPASADIPASYPGAATALMAQQPQPAFPGAAYATAQPGQPLSPATDPELQAAAVHHGRIANTLDAVSRILGGGQTWHLKHNADGSVEAQQV